MSVIVSQERILKSIDMVGVTASNLCIHCGGPVKSSYWINHSKENKSKENKEAKNFCCTGCFGAWTLIQGLDLSAFYSLARDRFREPSRSVSLEEFLIFDAPDFQKSFVTFEDSTGIAEVLIEGITCYACIWLIRQALHRKFPRVEIDVNQSTGAARLRWDIKELKLSKVVSFIVELGFQVLPHRGDVLANDQSELMRLGVALFIMINVMSFALVEYFSGADGVEATLLNYIRWISLTMTGVSLAWPGQAFFRSTRRSIRARVLTVDGPILLGLLVAFAYSCLNTIQGKGGVFFDSITAVIALVLAGRYVQSMALKRNQTRLAALIKPRNGYVLKSDGTTYTHTEVSRVSLGDKLKILPGDFVTLNVRCDSSCVDYSLSELNGEPSWLKGEVGQTIPAGAVNGGSPFEATALESGVQSYVSSLGKLVASALESKGQYQRWSDLAVKYLFSVVLVAAFATLIWQFQINPEQAFQRFVAILLVACPCTFALGIPLTFATAMNRALSEGILFKNQQSLEKLSTVNEIIFDKTGTLTQGEPAVLEDTWLCSEHDKFAIIQLLANLKLSSSHHVAVSLANWAQEFSKNIITAQSFEVVGNGLIIKSAQLSLHIGSEDWMRSLLVSIPPQFSRATTIVASNNIAVAGFVLDDKMRDDSRNLTTTLRQKGLRIGILSGDSSQRTSGIATALDIPVKDEISHASPINKSNYIHKKQLSSNVAMVGNGLNDSVAMAEATVGIAVAGASNPAQLSAEICILKDDLMLVDRALEVSRRCVLKMKAAFAFAALYNLLGLGVAAAGYMSPLLAAVLMPISSLTVTKIATSWPKQSIKLERVN